MIETLYLCLVLGFEGNILARRSENICINHFLVEQQFDRSASCLGEWIRAADSQTKPA